MRIGDAERDAAAADLGEHFTAGRLSLEELHERLEAVFAAKTFGQLARIMSDLPGSGRLPGLARLARHQATPPAAGRPWMPAYGPAYGAGYGWTSEWNAGPRGSAMGSARAGFQPGWADRPGPRARGRETERQLSPADRAGKFAALSLLILAMLIWLFTALLFARHGMPSVGPIPTGK
ncbi:MAG TPA: DUF1707 domain-containing protein [Trebonia sp.]|jgi:hypothetical protein|nr:DUF1707 domain-containing protein [Trebonia sp.]